MLACCAVASRKGRDGIKMGTRSRVLKPQEKDTWGGTFLLLQGGRGYSQQKGGAA